MTNEKKGVNERLLNLLNTSGLSLKEIEALLHSGKQKTIPKAVLSISGKSFMYGYISDTHIGHKKFLMPLFDKATRLFKKEKVDFVLHCGDHTEGMSGRPGHVYELDAIGFEQQVNLTQRLYEQIPIPILGIDGNHDLWYEQGNSSGAIVGENLQQRLKNYTHLGQMEGDIEIDGIKIKLIHPADGTAYAASYKLQKLIESFTGGEKPDIVHEGHYHKALYLFCRNVHGFECGTLCGQTRFMRGKKIQAHCGFGTVRVFTDKNGIDRLIHEFVPYYEM